MSDDTDNRSVNVYDDEEDEEEVTSVEATLRAMGIGVGPNSHSSSGSSIQKRPISQLTMEKVAVTRTVLEKKYKDGALVRKTKDKYLDKNGTQNAESTSSVNKKPRAVDEEYRKLMQKTKKSVHDFDKITVIGRGAFGEVRLVREKDGQKRVFAMKVLRKSEMLKRNQVLYFYNLFIMQQFFVNHF